VVVISILSVPLSYGDVLLSTHIAQVMIFHTLCDVVYSNTLVYTLVLSTDIHNIPLASISSFLLEHDILYPYVSFNSSTVQQQRQQHNISNTNTTFSSSNSTDISLHILCLSFNPLLRQRQPYFFGWERCCGEPQHYSVILPITDFGAFRLPAM